MEGAFSSEEKKKTQQEKEKNWVNIQIKGLSAWVNSYLQSAKIALIKDLQKDLQDGVKLNQFLTIVSGKKITFDLTPQMKIHKIQNLSIAINFVQDNLKVRLIGISAEDIERGDIKLILGLIYSVFRTVRISKISTQLGETDKKKNEAQQLIAWINTIVENEPYELKLETFKDGDFKNGKAFGALLHSYNNELFDYENMGDNAEENLKKIFETFEQKLGIPQLLDVEEVLNGTVDERAMTLYSSLIYHAHASQEERKKLEEGSMQRQKELEEERKRKKNLEEQHGQLLNEKERLESQNIELERSKIEELERRMRAEEESKRLEEERQRLEKEKQEQMEEAERIRLEKEQIQKEKQEEEEKRRQVEEEKKLLEEEREKLRQEKEQLEKQKEEERKRRKEQESLNVQITQEKDLIEKEKEKESELGKILQEKHQLLITEKEELELRRQELERLKEEEQEKRKRAEEETQRLEEARLKLEKEKQEQIQESERIRLEKERIEREKQEEEEKRKNLEEEKERLEEDKEILRREKEEERILQIQKTNEIILEKQKIEKEKQKEEEIRKLLEEEKKKLEEEKERLRQEKKELEKQKKEQKKLRKEAERQNEQISYEKDLESKEKEQIIDELKKFKGHLQSTNSLTKSLDTERYLMNDQLFLYQAMMDERYQDIEDYMRQTGKLATGESLVPQYLQDASNLSNSRNRGNDTEGGEESIDKQNTGGASSSSSSSVGGSDNTEGGQSGAGESGSNQSSSSNDNTEGGKSSSTNNTEGGQSGESAKRNRVVRSGANGEGGSSGSDNSNTNSSIFDNDDEGSKGKRNVRQVSEKSKLDLSSKDTTDKERSESKNRKKLLQQELNDLQERIKQEILRRKKDALALREMEERLKEYESKAIEQGEANRALDILKKNLMEHVEDLKVWVDLSELDLDSEQKEKYDPSLIRNNLQDKKFEEQIDYLGEQLQGENANMRRILEIKDSKKQLYDNYADKTGWLHMKTNKKSPWKSQWFVLKASELSYYPTEEKKVREGGVTIDSACSITLLKPEDAGDKTVYPIKIKLEGGNQFYIATSTKKGRKNWACLLKGKIIFSEYMHQVEESKTRPDIRLNNLLFATVDLGSIRMDNSPISKFTVSGVGQALSSFEDLNVVTFSNSEFTDEHASVLAPCLKKAFIRSLNLSDNHLTSEGAKLIAEAFLENKIIETIDFSGNELGNEGAESIANLIAQKKISSIDLENNKFTSEGAKKILEALFDHPKWTTLQFNGNNLGDEGCKAVAELISKNETVAEIQLARNHILDDGVKHLCSALRENTSVTHIDLSGNLLSQASIAYLNDLLKENKTIKFINVSENPQIVGGKGLEGVFSNEAFCLSGLTLTRTLLN